jgi:hypothetical protein
MKRVLMFAALMMWSAMSLAVVYKWTDAQGKTQYGDRPPDGVHAEIVELYGTHVARPAAPSPSAPRSANSISPAAANTPAADKEKKAVDADVAAVREKQCADAQVRYKQAIEGRRLYKLGENGERQYLTSEEIDSERLNAKRDLDTACGDSQ